MTYMFGKAVRDTRQGWALFAAMSVMFFAGVFICYWAEQRGNPMVSNMGMEHVYTGASRAATWRAKKFGSAIAHDRAFRDGNDGCQLRSCERHARQLHADRRPCSAVQYSDR